MPRRGSRPPGQSILVIDKNVEALIRIADRHYLIERGKVVWVGSSSETCRRRAHSASLPPESDNHVCGCWRRTTPAIGRERQPAK